MKVDTLTQTVLNAVNENEFKNAYKVRLNDNRDYPVCLFNVEIETMDGVIRNDYFVDGDDAEDCYAEAIAELVDDEAIEEDIKADDVIQARLWLCTVNLSMQRYDYQLLMSTN